MEEHKTRTMADTDKVPVSELFDRESALDDLDRALSEAIEGSPNLEEPDLSEPDIEYAEPEYSVEDVLLGKEPNDEHSLFASGASISEREALATNPDGHDNPFDESEKDELSAEETPELEKDTDSMEERDSKEPVKIHESEDFEPDNKEDVRKAPEPYYEDDFDEDFYIPDRKSVSELIKEHQEEDLAEIDDPGVIEDIELEKVTLKPEVRALDNKVPLDTPEPRSGILDKLIKEANKDSPHKKTVLKVVEKETEDEFEESPFERLQRYY